MSYWTYITGAIEVWPMGRTQPEKRYILDTVLEHLPKVTGSERDMTVHVVQKSGHNCSSSHNEFGEWIPGELHHTQDTYILVLEASLRDRMFDETKRELNNWLNRLAKRVGISDILVKLRAYDREMVISNPKPYEQMLEWASLSAGGTGEPCWCEYLMWDRAKDSEYPMKLAYKYFNDPENDAEYERRKAYEEGD